MLIQSKLTEESTAKKRWLF